MDLKAMFEEYRGLWEQMKAANDAAQVEIKRYGATSQELKTIIDTLNGRIDELEVKMKRPAQAPGTSGPLSEAKAAFLTFARKGAEALTPEQRKSLIRGDDTQGGYLASPEITQEIIKGITEFSPVRRFARVRTTSAKSIQVRKRTASFAAQWTSERGTRSETTGLAYGMEELPAHEMYALVDISLSDLEDSDFDLEAELRSEFEEQFGVAEGTAFVTGNSVGKPEGIMSNDSIGEVVSGAAATITGDGVVALYYELMDAYAQNASWMAKRSTLKAIRQLKDGMGNYLWSPGLAGGIPATILDRPYAEAADMPAIAANAYPLVFGDLRRAYVIADRVRIEVQRDPYTQPGFVRFHARKRVGGQVVLAEAIKKLKIAAS